MAYHAILSPQIGYSLETMTFEDEDLKKIQAYANNAYKPKIGLSRKFPIAVLQGSTCYCGLDHPEFYTTRGYKQLQLLVESLRNKDETGDLIKASLEYEQLNAGCMAPILEATTLSYQKWTKFTWIGSIKIFLESGITSDYSNSMASNPTEGK